MTMLDERTDIWTKNMAQIPGGTFRMGSNGHYPEEAPVHRVTVDGFWIDHTPVTNRQFKDFVKATGHKTFAEVPPDPKDYPGALPHMIYAGSLVFAPAPSVSNLRDWSQWWNFMKGADWRHPYGPKSNINVLDNHPVVHVAYADALAYAEWAVKDLPTEARLASLRAQLLPPLPASGAPRGTTRQIAILDFAASSAKAVSHDTNKSKGDTNATQSDFDIGCQCIGFVRLMAGTGFCPDRIGSQRAADPGADASRDHRA
jgi:hypothetical protein